MALRWIHDTPPKWDAAKAEIVGGAAPGIFDRRYSRLATGDMPPGEWWHVEDDGEVVGFGWMDVVWGDAEILLATAADKRGHGVGSFILDHLAQEAKKRGVNYLYNVVRPSHPEREQITRWLKKRGFDASEDGSLLRAIIKAK